MIQHDPIPPTSDTCCWDPLLDFLLTCARSYGYVTLMLGSLLKTPVATPLGKTGVIGVLCRLHSRSLCRHATLLPLVGRYTRDTLRAPALNPPKHPELCLFGRQSTREHYS